MIDEIILGDAFKLIKEVPSGCIDLILTSPPYGIGKSYERRSVTIDDYIKTMKPICEECVRVIRKGGALIWQVGNRIEGASHARGASASKEKPAPETIPLEMLYYPIFKSLGLQLRNQIVWTSSNTIPFRDQKMLQGRHEIVLYFTKGDNYTFNLDEIRIPQKYPDKKYPCWGRRKGEFRLPNPKGTNPGDVFRKDDEPSSDAWEITLSTNSSERWDHPAEFPEKLVERLIKMSTGEGNIVLDPFAGVGTTPKVAKDLGRHYLAFEKEPHYYNQAILRLAGIDQKGQMSLDTDFEKIKKKLVYSPKGELL
jgi:adenine-specific DNA-methyltransferase